MKFFLWLLSSPIIILSYVYELIMPKSIQLDLENCLSSIDNSEQLPAIFVLALITAEDHRSEFHPGIDPLAIFRSFLVKLKRGKWQGASTIEQQYVRIVTNRFERTGARKLREQVLAVMLSRRISKYCIASSYLSKAFYGTEFIGLKGLRSEFGDDLFNVSFNEALRMMVQLKYPRPRTPSLEWYKKNTRRLNIIIKRIEKNPHHITTKKIRIT